MSVATFLMFFLEVKNIVVRLCWLFCLFRLWFYKQFNRQSLCEVCEHEHAALEVSPVERWSWMELWGKHTGGSSHFCLRKPWLEVKKKKGGSGSVGNPRLWFKLVWNTYKSFCGRHYKAQHLAKLVKNRNQTGEAVTTSQVRAGKCQGENLSNSLLRVWLHSCTNACRHVMCHIFMHILLVNHKMHSMSDSPHTS